MKKIIFTILVIIATAIAGIGSALSHDYHMTTDSHIYYEEVILKIVTEKAAEEIEIPEIHYSNFDDEIFFVNLTFEEQELLEEIAMAEAKGEGSKGMALVMCVVLNRSREWNMSIKDVIFASGQFYTVGMEPGSDDCHEALAMVMEGWDESQGALFFNKYDYPPDREALFQYGAHYFSK